MLLPNALLISTLSFLPLSDLTSSSSICALLFVLSQEDTLWRDHCLRRWRRLQPYLKYRLLSKRDWAIADGQDPDELEDKEEKQPKLGPVRVSRGGKDEEEEEDEAPAVLTEGGWKARYIACELDLCRSLLTLPELLSHRWQFRFHFAFDDEHSVSHPHFTPGWVRTGMGDNTYPWKWTARDRLDKARVSSTSDDAGDDALAYVRRGFIARPAMDRILSRPRGPYWLRSCGSLAAMLAPSAPVDPTVAVAAPVLAEGSALRSAALPAHRYVPGWPFFTPTALQVKDCRTVRGMQVSHFPQLTISRLQDGGWQMINQYVIMHTINPDADEEGEEEEEAREGEEEEEDGVERVVGNNQFVGLLVAMVAFNNRQRDEEGGEEVDEGEEGQDEDEAAHHYGPLPRGLDDDDPMEEEPL